MSAPARRSRDEGLSARIRALGPWFHNLDLDGIATAPDHFLGDYPRFKWNSFAHAIPADLSGRTVLDIGCNGGFYALEMKRRGADRVVAIDADPRYLDQARLAAEINELEIEFRLMSVYEIAALQQRFDLVLFMGVLYHLRHPLLALDLIAEHVAADQLVCQSLIRGSETVTPPHPDHDYTEQAFFADDGAPRLTFIEHRLAGDPTNWWIPNRACLEAMIRSAGFTIEMRAADDLYLCRKS